MLKKARQVVNVVIGEKYDIYIDTMLQEINF
jgi:hypothetical protein